MISNSLTQTKVYYQNIDEIPAVICLEKLFHIPAPGKGKQLGKAFKPTLTDKSIRVEFQSKEQSKTSANIKFTVSRG